MIRKLMIAGLLLSAMALAQPSQGGAAAPPRGPEGRPDGPHEKFGPHGDGPMRPMLPPGRWWKNAEIAKTIGLNDGQVQKIEQVFQDSRMKLVDIHANLQKEEIKLEPMLESDNPDEAAVLASIDRIAAARANLEKANAQMAFAIRRILTPEQWKKLRAMPPHEHFPPPMGPPRGERSRPGPGDRDNPPPPPQDDAAPQGSTQAPPDAGSK